MKPTRTDTPRSFDNAMAAAQGLASAQQSRVAVMHVGGDKYAVAVYDPKNPEHRTARAVYPIRRF